MSKAVLLDCRLFVGGVDLSGSSNKLEFTDQAEEKEVTNWKSGKAKEFLAGLSYPQLAAEGFWEAGDDSLPDDAFWAARRQIEPWSASADSTVDLASGSDMYLTRALRGSYKFLGAVGDTAPWAISAVGSWPMAKGACMHAAGVPRTATGNGTGYQLGAVPSTKSMYVNLHVLSVADAAATLTVTVESDDNSGFSSATTRGTFSAASAIGGQSLRIAGPVTDDYWRIVYTIAGGSSPSFLFVVAAGIE